MTTDFHPTAPVFDRLLAALTELRNGNFQTRIPADGMPAELATVFNEIAARNEQL